MAFSPTEKAFRELAELQKLIEDFRTDLGDGNGRAAKRSGLLRRRPRGSGKARSGAPVSS
jgi:hypothetical protein